MEEPLMSIRELRTEKNVTGVELAQKLGIDTTTLSRYERGHRPWPAHLEIRARELLETGKCRIKTIAMRNHFALVNDTATQSFAVFFVHARDKEEIEEHIHRFYIEQGWDWEAAGDIVGFTIQPRTPLYMGRVAYPTSPIVRLPRMRTLTAQRKEKGNS